jgi:hypothetical protein
MNNRSNKKGEWQELILLSWRDFCDNGDKGPAVKVTFARYGREVRYSYTPGVLDDDGKFRSVQYLHDRNIHCYLELLRWASVVVAVARDAGVDNVKRSGYGLKVMLREEAKKLRAEKQEEKEEKEEKKKKMPSSISKPTFGVSIGEILKAKQK